MLQRELQFTVNSSISSGCGSASGERLPPYILYKGKNLYTVWTEGGPAGVLYGVSDSGWMEGANFLDWFKKLFLPAVQHLSSGPGMVLLVDGHHSHLTMTLIELAREKGIHLVCFPPHMTHILQPLDVSVYHPVKQSWAIVLKEYKLETMAENVMKAVFPSLIRKLWGHCLLPHHLKSGFRTTGLYPLNRRAIPESKLATGIPFSPLISQSSQSSTSTASASGQSSQSATSTSTASASGQSSQSSTSTSTTSASGQPSQSSASISTASASGQPSQSSSTMVSKASASQSSQSLSACISIQASAFITIRGGCKQCGAELTPMRPHLMQHFEQLLQKRNAQKTVKRRRIKPQYYGEALTSDEIYQRLQEDEKEKQQSKQQRKRGKQPVAQKKQSAVAEDDDVSDEDSGQAEESDDSELHDEGIPYVHTFITYLVYIYFSTIV